MKGDSYFQVDEILSNGMVVGRNDYSNIPVETIFGCIRKTKIVGERENLLAINLDVVASVSLQLDKV